MNEPGVSQTTVVVDASGRVLRADETATALLSTTVDACIGRNLFDEVAPAFRVPGFFGRFLNGVRSGVLDATFPFMLGCEDGARELLVTLSDGPEPGTVAIGLSVVRTVEPSRQREAMLAIGLRANAQPVDPNVCEQEPIHVPGTIQSHGALLATGRDGFVVSVTSDNLVEMLGLPPDVLGRRLDDVLPKDLCERLLREVDGAGADDPPVRLTCEIGEPPRPFSVAVHRRDERLLVEFELAPLRPQDFNVPGHAVIRATVRALRQAADLGALVEEAAHRIRQLTGFERVLIYRFDAEWNGEAVAESRTDAWPDSLMGLRFPASDIPRQARELYRHAPLRFVVDRDAAPVPLRGAADDNHPVDLSAALFRSLSPIHLEYQRNLGVNGSMSAAITVDGKLWGLVIGHHRRPHYLAAETRDAIAVVTDALALRLHDLEGSSFIARRNEHLAVEQRLLSAMAASDDFVSALTADGSAKLVDLFGATGAAVVAGDEVTTVGTTPELDDVVALADAIRRDGAGDPAVFATDHLAERHPPAERYRAVASGALATFVDPDRQVMLVWFRPEVASTVVWSGDPNKPVLADAASAAVLPRRSFERWVEERRGVSLAWQPWEIDIAVALARAVVGVALRQSRRVEELSLKQDELLAAIDEKDALIAQKDLLTREIDHRVKNSLQIVSAFVSMQSRHLRDPAAVRAFQETYGRVMSIARVHDSLYQSDDLQQVDLGQTIENLCRDLAGVGGERRELELKAEPGLMVPYRKAVALCLIATELVTNAWKYAYPDTPTGFVEVSVQRHDAERVTLRVRDEGAGLPDDWESRPRKGLGMQLIRAMLGQIDATMQVDRADGASFTVTC